MTTKREELIYLYQTKYSLSEQNVAIDQKQFYIKAK